MFFPSVTFSLFWIWIREDWIEWTGIWLKDGGLESTLFFLSGVYMEESKEIRSR